MLTSQQGLSPDPLDAHFPLRVTVSPEITPGIKVNMPPIKPPKDSSEYGEDFEDFAVETHEWLSLISLGSPRINADDQIDSFLSRYVPPAGSTTPTNLVRITWRGFLSPSWAHKMFVQALVVVPQKAWFVYSAAGFGEVWAGGGKDCTILKVPDAPKEYLLWEVAQ
jgi:ribonuclease P/MRP protein subunit RPP40